MKSIAKRLTGLTTKNEVFVSSYTGISLLIVILVATSDNIWLILASVVNLALAVRQLNKIEDRKMP